MAKSDRGGGKDFAAAGICGEAAAIERDVIRRVSHSIRLELIELAVEDAVKNRKPRWRGSRGVADDLRASREWMQASNTTKWSVSAGRRG
jgi:hypothetical protein